MGVFVNGDWTRRAKDLGLTAKEKLEAAVHEAVGAMRADAEFLRLIEKTCLAFEKRARWVAANGGRKVVRSRIEKSD